MPYGSKERLKRPQGAIVGADLYLLVMLVISGGFAGARIWLCVWSCFLFRFRGFSWSGTSRGFTCLTVGFLSGGGVLQLLNNYSTNIQQLFNNYSTIIQQPSPRAGDYSTSIQPLFNNDSTMIQQLLTVAQNRSLTAIDGDSTLFNNY